MPYSSVPSLKERNSRNSVGDWGVSAAAFGEIGVDARSAIYSMYSYSKQVFGWRCHAPSWRRLPEEKPRLGWTSFRTRRYLLELYGWLKRDLIPPSFRGRWSAYASAQCSTPGQFAAPSGAAIDRIWQPTRAKKRRPPRTRITRGRRSGKCEDEQGVSPHTLVLSAKKRKI